MAENEISDYLETDNDNVDIAGISVQENVMRPPAVNNAFRALQGALKRWFKTSLFRLRDSTDQTKLLAFDLSGITTGTTRTITVPDSNVTLGTITPWVAYTPTITGFGTPTGVSMFSRRVGDTLEIMGRFTAGTTTATEARMTLGFNGTNGGITIDVPSIRLIGAALQSVAEDASIVTLGEPSVGYITFGVQSGTATGFSKANGNQVLATGNTISILASVPIVGW